MGKGEIACYEHFSFSCSVFKRLILQTCKNRGLYGKGLSLYKTTPDFTDPGKKYFENIVEKGGNAGNIVGIREKCWLLPFSPFPLMFSNVFTIKVVKKNLELLFYTRNFSINFRVLDKCPDGVTFIVMCFSCRTIEALGAAAYVTSLFAILFHEFSGNVMTVIVCRMCPTFSLSQLNTFESSKIHNATNYYSRFVYRWVSTVLS